MAIKTPPIKALRSGGVGIGNMFLVSTETINQLEGIWICGSDYMIDQRVPDLPKTVYDMLDASDGKVTLRIEGSNDQWTTVWVDYEGDVGRFIVQLRQPLFVGTLSQIGDLRLEIPPDKVIPLPPEFEQALSALSKQRKRTFNQFKDGTFKLGQ